MQSPSQLKPVADRENLVRDEKGAIQNIDKEGLAAAKMRKAAQQQVLNRIASLEERVRQLEERYGA